MRISHFTFQKTLQNFLFWMHAVVIAGTITLGFFITPLWALALIILHRLHVLVLGECLLSKIQRKIGGLQSDKNFLQHLANRIFGKEIGYRGSLALDYSLAGTMLLISLIK